MLKKVFVVLVLLLSTALGCLASEAPRVLTFAEARSVLNGLTELNKGWQEVVKDGREQHVVAHQFRLDDGLRKLFGLTMVRLIEADKANVAALTGLRRTYAEGHRNADGVEDVPAKNSAAYEAAAQEQIARPSSVSVDQISITELKLKDNPEMPFGVVTMLAPILEQDKQ